jgi:D-glucosaminate-6-phosphate ammonia-lyase
MTSLTRTGIRERLGLRPIINVSGTMTALGASIGVREAVESMSAVLPEFVEINDLHRLASKVIAKLTDGEAGFVTSSCSAGITLAVAGCMTGADLAKVEQLPDHTGMKSEVVILSGHMVSYGAPVEQAIRIAGAQVVPVGAATDARGYQLRAKLNAGTAAAVYVVSHHAVDYGQIPLPEFVAICHEADVPVIVDAASEYDLKGFLATGADLAVYSSHKFLGGPTAGFVAGRKDLVRATFLQNMGIGRGMKVGKESIVGTIAALEAWERRDHDGIRATETSYLELWRDRFNALSGVTATVVPDPTNNPLDRLRLALDPAAAKLAAWELADRLAAGSPPVIIRDHEIEHGYFFMDPCNLHPGEAEIVADRVETEVKAAQRRNDSPQPYPLGRRAGRFEKLLRWPD